MAAAAFDAKEVVVEYHFVLAFCLALDRCFVNLSVNCECCEFHNKQESVTVKTNNYSHNLTY